ncbi:Prolyl 4-hydroxylase, alpha subunit [Penicillium expansum]|uniref:Prolyl 4-hydroxylase, alpha subunit n=1 Tax=Penicillium expansum TaxID=27334 RepID=A0A0A2J418_PENEN|nr:Prolyl 4-hydroxylase, alpha subunit [Penicillium expansum]KGO44993.1 Prolyl 4-hydroxylase, alpha subunit [Penicillium expansum]KGO47110.1 Prolyl 4-hydroxylase, alpha subunit [Penicillium expansum]KGO60307.1 Prolyl 4-hydroxylase, alpha subunit [Penicillium expansum]
MTVPNISDSFLRGPAPNAALHKLDFERTSPPIPEYKGHFAAIVDNFMTEAECKELVRLAEESTRSQLPDSTLSPPVWEHAMVNAGGGRQVMSIDTRKSGRIILDSPDLATRILDRMMPFMRECELDRVQRKPLVTGLGPAKRGEVLCLSRLNERLRFLRYEGGDYFRHHCDGCFVTPDGLEKSLYTIHLYLNGEGEQDMEELLPHIERAENTNLLFAKNWEINLAEVESEEAEVDDGSCTSATESLEKNEALLGGATSFMAGLNWRESLRVFPKTGSVLIFQQRNLFHGGDDVFRGVKYTLRTDVMYTTE